MWKGWPDEIAVWSKWRWFWKYKKIVSEFTNNDKNLDESTLEIMNIAYSTGGDYSDETLIAYVKAYFEMNSTNKNS